LKNGKDLNCFENGEITCADLHNALSQVEETHGMMSKFVSDIGHLEKLDTIAKSLGTIEDKFIDALSGESSGPTKLASQMIRVLGLVIIGLTIVIVFLLTGQHFGWIPAAH